MSASTHDLADGALTQVYHPSQNVPTFQYLARRKNAEQHDIRVAFMACHAIMALQSSFQNQSAISAMFSEFITVGGKLVKLGQGQREMDRFERARRFHSTQSSQSTPRTRSFLQYTHAIFAVLERFEGFPPNWTARQSRAVTRPPNGDVTLRHLSFVRNFNFCPTPRAMVWAKVNNLLIDYGATIRFLKLISHFRHFLGIHYGR